MLHWGVIGLGKIAHRFVRSLSYFDEADFYAGASRSQEKRQLFKDKYHPTCLYDSYEDLLNDINVDVVYIALAHKDHYQWCKKALEANKCVLVEKPACLHTWQIEALTDLAKKKHLFFMEAMKTRFIPLTKILHQEIKRGLIGEIVSIENHFCSDVAYQADSYLFDPLQGGALYDTGIYCIASILDFIKSDIDKIEGEFTYQYGVDVHDQVTLSFKNGMKASFECAIDSDYNREMIITGTKGTIRFSPFYRGEKAIVETSEDSLTCEVKLPYDDFYPEIEAVHQNIAYIRVEDPRMSHQDSIECIKLMERIKALGHG